MRFKKWTRPCLETLESRWTPATVVFSGSLLTVTMNRSNLLSVQEVAVGQYKVTEGTSLVGIYKTSGITINGTNANDIIVFDFLDGGGMGGTLTVRSKNGNDTINIVGEAGATVAPTIRGGIIIDSGYGNDVVNIATDSDLSVRGTANVNGSLGSDTLNIGTGAAGLAQLTALTATDFNFVNLGSSGGASFAASGAGTITPGTGAYPMNVTLGSNGSINKLSVTGSAQDDLITIEGLVTGILSGGGDALTVNTGLGDDTLSLLNDVGSLISSTGVTWQAGDGTDTIETAPGITIGGNLNLHMVQTVNDEGNVFLFGAGTVVGGNLLISEITSQEYGNAGPVGGQVIDFDGEVGGDVILQLGGGDHTLNFVLAGLGGSDYTGYLNISNYTSNTANFGGPGTGEGNNVMTFDFGASAQINVGTILMGSGDDSLTFVSSAAFFTIAGDPINGSTFDGGGGFNPLTVPVSTNYQDIFPFNWS